MGKLVVMPRTAPPPKIFNLEKRSREHLFPTEVKAMVSAAKKVGRHGLRDSTLILMAYRHGLRVSELIALKWEQIDFTAGTIYINRLKNGVSSTHPLRGVELIPFLENSEIVKLRQKAEGRRQRAEEIEFLNFYLFERKRFKSPVTFENWY